jgi:AcrR family transcriptional regulator
MRRRDKQAADTRRDILDAALRLFAERGYARTSIAEIATEAGVAVPTLYTSVGTKSALLRQLLDTVDEQAGVAELARRVHAETNPATVVELEVQITRQIVERSGDIIRALASAAVVEAEMAETYAAGNARHRAGAVSTVDRLIQLKALRPGLSPADATAIVAAMTSTMVYEMLTSDFGWTFDQCAQWLTTTLSTQLLAPDVAAG